MTQNQIDKIYRLYTSNILTKSDIMAMVKKGVMTIKEARKMTEGGAIPVKMEVRDNAQFVQDTHRR